MRDNNRTPTGGYRTPSGEYRNASGGHRTASGSHRVEQGAASRWRLLLILAGVAAGVAVCVVSAVVILVLGDRSSGPSGQVSAQGAGTPQAASGGEHATIPDTCGLVTDQQAEKLVPHFERDQVSSASSTDTHSQCAWTLFSTDSAHQLTVELRAITGSGGRTGTAVAEQTYETERASDDAGKGGLSTTQHITYHKTLQNMGDAAYIAYSVDDSTGSQKFGDAGLNARVANVLVTVHYGGSEHGGPMRTDQAIAGATETAKNLIHSLLVAS